MPAGGLRVALLHPCFWPEVRRGAERFTRELADGLLELGHRPRLVTSHPAPATRSVEDGLVIVRNRRPSQRVVHRLGLDDYVSHVPRSYLTLRQGDDHLAHALNPADALAAIAWARRTGRPAVFSHMGTPERTYLRGRRLRFTTVRAAAAGADAVVALSRSAAAGFRNVLGVDARVIYPGVDLDAFAPDPAARASVPTIVCPAALDATHKRVGLLLSAFEVIRARLPDARLVLSRPRDAAVAAHVVGDVPGVELVDLDAHATLERAYREAWVCVLPSINEAFGLVLVEALSCGTPIVASDSGGMPEILAGHPEVGRLFQGEDPAALAEAVGHALELVADPETADACRARARDFSRERCAAAYELLYRELLGDTARAARR
jgi:phosphatidylinositol alpha-mannosyltransferase